MNYTHNLLFWSCGTNLLNISDSFNKTFHVLRFKVWRDLQWSFYCKCTAEYASERIFKISQQLTKL